MEHPKRPVIKQFFVSTALTVKTKPTPINTSFQQAQPQFLYDAFIVSVPKLGPNGVTTQILMGDSSVSIAQGNGQEILPGIPIMWSIDNERQLYELQTPLVEQFCKNREAIPFTAWDLATVYLIGEVESTVGIILFQASYL